MNFDKKQQNPPEKEQDTQILYGKHMIMTLLQEEKQINKILLQKGLSISNIKGILKMASEQGVIYQEVPKSKLDELTSGQNHQGIVATLPAYDYKQLEDALALAKERSEDPFLLILDEIEDPHNLGSILRTADATGVHGVIIPKRRSVGLTGVVAKTSTGAIEHVPVIRVTNLSQMIQSLKNLGIWVFATDMNGEDMRNWNASGPIALVIGNEGKGVSQNIKKISDGVVTIPMVGHVQSLNASVAASILMYEVARSRI